MSVPHTLLTHSYQLNLCLIEVPENARYPFLFLPYWAELFFVLSVVKLSNLFCWFIM